MGVRGVNKVILIGNLGNEPEVRYFPSGDAVANFNIATSESWKDRNSGEVKERTDWHRVVIIGKLAEIAKQYLHKGSKVYIEGKLRTRKWQGQDGQDRYTTEVVVDLTGTMQMLDGRATTTELDSASPAYATPAPAAARPTSDLPPSAYGGPPAAFAPYAGETTPAHLPPQQSDYGSKGGNPTEVPFDDDIPF